MDGASLFRNFFRELIRDYEKSDPLQAADALRCVPRIKCWMCLDSERIIYDRMVLTFFGYSPYEMKKCPSCQGNNDHVKCVDSNRLSERGRPVPYHGQWATNPYSMRDIVYALASIYRQEYKAIDEVEEAAYTGMTDEEVLSRAAWQHIQSSAIDSHIREWELEVDVKAVVDNVTAAIQAYCGNVVPLVDIIANMKAKFGANSEELKIDELLTKVDVGADGQPFLLKIAYHLTDDKDGLDVSVINFFRKSRHVRGELKMMKPALGNGAAAEICRRMIGREARRVFWQ